MTFPALAHSIFGGEKAPLDTACTNHMRNSAIEFMDISPDDSKVFFGSQSYLEKSRGTYATVPDVLCVPGMMVTALWSF